jgi:hypothetical protein
MGPLCLTLRHVSSTGDILLAVWLQGGTIGYSMLSAKPEYNDKITVMIGMGPVWMTQFLGVPFLSAMSKVNNGNVGME